MDCFSPVSSIEVEPVTVLDRRDSKGRLKSRLRYVDRTKFLRKGIVLIPKHCGGLIGAFCTFILIFLAAALYVYFAPRPGLYGESCAYRSCTKGLNLHCINKICQCEYGQYYSKGCKIQLNYGKKCSSNNVDICLENTNLLCMKGICQCETLQFWNGSKCRNQYTYGQTCTNNSQCLSNLLLSCNIKTKKCECPSNR